MKGRGADRTRDRVRTICTAFYMEEKKKWIGDTDTMALVTYEGTRQTAYQT